LAEVVFHELFHNTLYVKGAGAFNESVANFVGGRSAIDFFRDRFGAGSAEHERAIRAWEEELEFSAFIEKLAASLDELYTKEIPEEEKLRLRQGVFARAKEEWSEWITQHPTHRFRYFAQQPLNNAVIIHYWLYLKNLKLFEALYEAEGKNLVQTIDSIREGVAKGGEPFEAVQTLLSKRNNQAVVKSRVVE
jgi:predicted aminopeptidase